MLVHIYRIGETCGPEQVTPVSIGKLYRHTQLFHASLAQRERSKTNALQSVGGFSFQEGQVVTALGLKELYNFTVLP